MVSGAYIKKKKIHGHLNRCGKNKALDRIHHLFIIKLFSELRMELSVPNKWLL